MAIEPDRKNLIRLTIASLVGLTTIAVLTTTMIAVRAQDEDLLSRRAKRSTFMKMKLEYSKNLLEGLTVEDFDKIKANAKALKAMSQAAEWEVPEIPNVQEYLTYSADFQRLCDELVRASDRKSIDGTTLNYVQLTVNCVKCHQYVRFKKN
ncbi:MAG: hypothetical protein RJA81_2000 [Planctomycetota bacterium]|jgi:cytochrome c556